MTKLALILYANEAHSEVSTPLYNELHEKGYNDTFYALNDVPFIWSTQGIDFDLMKTSEGCPSFEGVSTTRGTYTHVLPTFYPETLDLQLALGNKSIPNQSKVGMLPEFDFASGQIETLKAAGWEYVLLNRDINKQYDHRDNMSRGITTDADTFVNVENDLGSRIKGIVTEGGNLRNIYLAMVRGMGNAKDFIEEVDKVADKNGCDYVPFLIDAEAVQMNGGLEHFQRFIGELTDSKLDLVDFSGIDGYKPQSTINVASRPKPKWLFESDAFNIVDKIKSIDHHELDSYSKKALLWASVSDLYSAFAGLSNEKGYIVDLPRKDVDGEDAGVVRIQSDKRRPPEVYHVFESVERGQSVTENTDAELDDASKKKMSLLDKVFKEKG